MLESVYLKSIAASDVKDLWEVSYGPKADLKWMALNGPYFEDPIIPWEDFSNGLGKNITDHPMIKMIMVRKRIVGLVTGHFEDGELKQWLDMGVLIYDEQLWGKGIGSIALAQWMDELFNLFPYLPHLGFTTWSGNPGMQKVGEKCGMQKEGVIRQVRYWQGEYYDSVKYGILRTEYEERKHQKKES